MTILEQKVDVLLRLAMSGDYIEQENLMAKARELLAESPISPIRQQRVSAKDIDKVISDLAQEFGIPKNLKGYPYFCEAVRICAEDLDVLNSITKVLYPRIAEKFNTTPSRVERAIRHAIEVAIDKCDYDTLCAIFGNTISPAKGKPTNSECIAQFAYAAIAKMSD